MSHFTVMVIGATDIATALEPFQENNMGDCPAEYLEFEDCTEEVQEGWDKLSADDKAEHASMASFAEDYFGYEESEEEPGKFGRTHNPNSKWDWYRIGGRWSGFLKLKAGAKGKLGQRSLLDDGPDERNGYADQARKGDIDVEGMRNEAGEKAGKKWDIINPVVGPHEMTFMPWELAKEMSMRNGEVDYELARKTYHGQDVRKAIIAAADDKDNPHRDMFVWLDDLQSYFMPREEFVQIARNGAIGTFAILKDGQWVERGEMGWFGIVTNEGDKNAWDQQFNDMFDALPDDTLVTIVDCHV